MTLTIDSHAKLGWHISVYFAFTKEQFWREVNLDLHWNQFNHRWLDKSPGTFGKIVYELMNQNLRRTSLGVLCLIHIDTTSTGGSTSSWPLHSCDWPSWLFFLSWHSVSFFRASPTDVASHCMEVLVYSLTLNMIASFLRRNVPRSRQGLKIFSKPALKMPKYLFQDFWFTKASPDLREERNRFYL